MTLFRPTLVHLWYVRSAIQTSGVSTQHIIASMLPQVCRYAHEQLQERVKSVDCFVSLRGSASGGTMRSALNMFTSWDSIRSAVRPNLLNPLDLNVPAGEWYNPNAGPRPLPNINSANEQPGAVPPCSDLTLPGRLPHDRKFRAPFVMAGVNTRVVRRSAALFSSTNWRYDGPDGEGFRYSEVMEVPSRLKSFLACVLTPLVSLLLLLPFVARLLLRVVPGVGRGPSVEQRAKGWFAHRIVGETESGDHVYASFGGGDPGYTETAKMLSEAALSAVEGKEDLPGLSGYLTPATAFGHVLVNKLREAGMKLQVGSDQSAWDELHK